MCICASDDKFTRKDTRFVSSSVSFSCKKRNEATYLQRSLPSPESAAVLQVRLAVGLPVRSPSGGKAAISRCDAY
jgi:hypothetical protein